MTTGIEPAPPEDELQTATEALKTVILPVAFPHDKSQTCPLFRLPLILVVAKYTQLDLTDNQFPLDLNI